MKNKKILSLLIVVFVAALIISIVSAVIHSRRQKAIETAKAYVEKTYGYRFEYDHVFYSFIDPALYHVFFYPEDDPNMIFEVIVQNDLSITAEIHLNNCVYGPDNYIIKQFENRMEQTLYKVIHNADSSSISITVLQRQDALYAFKYPLIQSPMELDAVEPLFDYTVYISTNLTIRNRDDALFIAKNSFQILDYINSNGYSPSQVLIRDKNTIIPIEDFQKIKTAEKLNERIIQYLEF